jgi:4-amino-4-deoxy-L-arabinose transferase-like glycosyltransferase
MASASAWAFLFLLFGFSAQDFPLADDWAFGAGAFRFASGQGAHYFHHAALPQFGQWLWAWPFIRVLGESFTALRLSTIVLSWLGLWGFHDLLRQEGIDEKGSSFLAAVLALNPLFFLLQGTFMTDVPALSLALLALAFYGRAAASGRHLTLWAGMVIAAMAVATRQFTIMVPLVAAIMAWPARWRLSRIAWTVALLVPVGVGIVCHVWLQTRSDVTQARMLGPTLSLIAIIVFIGLHLGGLSALPAMVIDPRPGPLAVFGASCAALSGIACYLWRDWPFLSCAGLFPYVDGIVTRYGAYVGAMYPGWGQPEIMDQWLRLALTALGCLAGAVLLARLVQRLRTAERSVGALVWFALSQLVFIVSAPWIFDRYFLVLVPGALSLAAPILKKGRVAWILGLSALTAYGLFSLALMHDWLAWNSARWELGQLAVDDGIPPDHIDGGFEWNGWAETLKTDPRFHAGSRPRRYLLSFWEIPGMTTIASRSYVRWLVPGAHSFYLLQEPQAPVPPSESR